MKLPVLFAGFCEDSAEIIFCIKDYLVSSAAYQPYVALNEREAFDCLQRNHPRLIVIYFGANARAASLKWLEEVRKKYGRGFKILIVTSYSAASLRSDCQRLNVDVCLEPPIKLELIKKSVEMVLKVPMSEYKKILILVLRWIALLPAGLLASTIAYYAIFYGSAVMMASDVEPSSLMGRLFLYWIAPCGSGLAFVWASVYVAPSHKKHVAVIVAGILLFFSGGSVLLALGERNYWSVYQFLTLNVGTITVAIAFVRGEIGLPILRNKAGRK